MSEADEGRPSSSGLPGELVQSVAERLKEENSDLQEYGYRLAVVPDDGSHDTDVEDPPASPEGHWAEVEIQKLPNNDLAIRLRGYTESVGSQEEQRTAELIRELLREALF